MDKDIYKTLKEVPKAKTTGEAGTVEKPKPKTLREFIRAHNWLVSVPLIIVETIVLYVVLHVPAALVMQQMSGLLPFIAFAILWGIRYWYRRGELKIHDAERHRAAQEDPQKYRVWHK